MEIGLNEINTIGAGIMRPEGVVVQAWNAVGYITPEGELVMVLKDLRGVILKRPTNICFGWKNLETAFIGSLDGTDIPNFRAPYPGMKLVHQ